MKVSVIICAYNAEKTISKTIQSVLSQTYSNYEIVVINDGSKDATLEIVQKYQQENPNKIIIKSIPNGGLANARNHGIALCTGELYMNLDADDYLEADTLEKAVEVFKQDSQIDICFYGYKSFDEQGRFFDFSSEKIYFPDRPITGLEVFQMRMQRKLWIHQGSALYRIELIRKNGIENHPGKNQGEDMYFISRCLLAARKVACFQGDNFCYMARSDSMNHENYNPSFFQILELLDCLEEDVRRDYSDQLNEILPFVYAERLIQALAIAKRMARYFSMNEYLREVKSVRKVVMDFDNSLAGKLLDRTKKLEYRVCHISAAAYYFMTRLYDSVGK